MRFGVCTCGTTYCWQRTENKKICCASNSISMGMEIAYKMILITHFSRDTCQIMSVQNSYRFFFFALFSLLFGSFGIGIGICVDFFSSFALQTKFKRAMLNYIRIGSMRGMIFKFVNDLSRPERKGAYVRQKCFNFVGRLPVNCSCVFFCFCSTNE